MTRPPEDPSPNAAKPEGAGGLSSAAASGTGWTTIQGLINKVATMVATYIVSMKLSPDEFGMATLVVAIGGFLIVLPPLVMGDVLITHQRRFRTMVRTAGSMVLWIGVLTTVVVAAVSPLMAHFYPNYAFGTLVGLLIVLSLRPSGDALAVVPLSRLRIDLRYRAIALIDGSVQMVATITTVVMAFLGAGALSLVLPQVAAIAAKAVCYRVAAAGHAQDGLAPRPHARRQIRGRMMREFSTAGSAQYIHTLIGWVPVLVLGKLATETETGFFSFAFLLANQATFVISYQLGTVLQPIFGRLKHEPARQAAGFLRVVRAIGALAVPVSFLQAALAQPLFLLVFEPKWAGAAPVFAVLCIGQAFYFAMAPAMALLKAQGRFRAFFVWQAVQLAASLALYPLSALAGDALGVAICDTIVWGVSVPIAVWLGTRIAGGRAREAVAVFLAPWSTAVPIAAAAFGAWYLMQPLGTAGMVLSLFVVGPIALALSIWATRFSQPATYAELQPMMAKIGGKLGRLPRSVLARIAGG
ncbi:MAG: oligosaccharide flippase family protein, partial [Phycisphaerae bacterium]|nr:oligosaccharide flippase family protein [Phycisphaerae bacterium]